MNREPMFEGLDSLREWLVSNGFSVSENAIRISNNEANWIAYRRAELEVRECECNDKKISLIVEPFERSLIGYSSCEIEIIGEAGGVWFMLKAYSLKPQELMQRLPKIERQLVAAWNALIPIENRKC